MWDQESAEGGPASAQAGAGEAAGRTVPAKARASRKASQASSQVKERLGRDERRMRQVDVEGDGAEPGDHLEGLAGGLAGWVSSNWTLDVVLKEWRFSKAQWS